MQDYAMKLRVGRPSIDRKEMQRNTQIRRKLDPACCMDARLHRHEKNRGPGSDLQFAGFGAQINYRIH